MDPDQLAGLKKIYGVTDPAILIEKLTALSEKSYQEILDKMMYVKFNSMTPSE
jgi:hypothetical protein